MMATGCACQMTDRLSPNLSLSYTAVEIDATFIGYVDGVQVLDKMEVFRLIALLFEPVFLFLF